MFKVGNRVQAVKDCHIYYKAGCAGTVVEVSKYDYQVDFDKVEGVHINCEGGSIWFVTEVVAEATPSARTNDPATSKGKRKVNKYEQAVLTELNTDVLLARSPGALGLTGKEIAVRSGHPLNCITPRFAPLRRRGLIKDSGSKRDKQIVWVLA
jgi:hypothetical protein